MGKRILLFLVLTICCGLWQEQVQASNARNHGHREHPANPNAGHIERPFGRENCDKVWFLCYDKKMNFVGEVCVCLRDSGRAGVECEKQYGVKGHNFLETSHPCFD